MRIQINPSALRQTKWHEYLMRFIFGGIVTALTGIIATKYGPVVGGLFLACPAIFPASATLIEKHEREKKQRLGMRGATRGIEAASVDATGAAIGSIGLFVFGIVFWKLSPDHRSWSVLIFATLAWFLVSLLMWHFRKRDQQFPRARRSKAGKKYPGPPVS